MYADIANGVAKMRMQASDTFKNNDETLAFLETMNKSFVVGGASIEEQKSAMLQLTQAMASGKLQGDELRSLAETSPALIQAIADKIGVTRGEVKKLGADGKITSEIVKQSMLEASSKIDEQFKNMPLTWGRAWQMFLNYMNKSLAPLSSRLNQLVNSSAFQRFAGVVSSSIQFVIQMIMGLIDILGSLIDFLMPVGQAIHDNFDIIAPIILGIVGAIAVYNATMMIANVLTSLQTVFTGVYSLAMGLLAVATGNAAAAQSFFNAVLAANPIMIVVMAIILLIGLLYAGVAVWNHFTGEAVSATGLIVGAIFWLGAAVWNVIAFIANAVVSCVEFIVNLWFELDYQAQTAWYNIAKGGRDMAVSIGSFIDSMANAALSTIEGLVNGILDGFNKVSEFLGGLGINIGTAGHVNLGRTNFAGGIANAIDTMALLLNDRRI